MKEEKTLSRFTAVFIALIAGLLPVFFLPYISDPLFSGKLLLFMAAGVLSLILYFIQIIKKQSWQFVLTPLTIPVLVFLVTVILSVVLNFQYPQEQLTGMGAALIMSSLLIIFLPSLFASMGSAKIGKKFQFAMMLSAAFLGILSILQAFGLGIAALIAKISLFQIPDDLSFSLTGSSFLGIQFLSSVFIALLLTKKTWKGAWMNLGTMVITGTALIINIWAILPGKIAAFTVLPLNASLAVAKSSLSYTMTALFGYGVANYGNAYNYLKPVWVNGQEYWQYVFNSAFNWPLTMIVSLGILGTLAWLWTSFQTVKVVQQGENRSPSFLKYFILAILLWQFFAPFTMLMMVMLSLAIAVFLAENTERYRSWSFNFGRAVIFPGKTAARNLNVVINLGIISLSLGILVLGFGFLRTTLAKAMLYQTNISASTNDIPAAYDKLQSARNLDPYSSAIRKDYALLNLDVAISLSNKTDLSAAEQEQIIQLVNQAITEAKAATTLDHYNAQNWLVLAEIYMQLLESSEEAVPQAYYALSQAAVVSPNDPNIRLQLGQFFYGQKQYDQAATFFQQAVERKADLAAPYYWLARSLVELEQYEDANSAYVKTLTLLTADTEEYDMVSKEYEQFKETASKAIQEQQAQQGQTQGKLPESQLPANSQLTPDMQVDSGIEGIGNSSPSANLGELMKDQQDQDAEMPPAEENPAP